MDFDLTTVLLIGLFLVFMWYFVGGRMNRQRSFRFFAILGTFFETDIGRKPGFKNRLEVVVIEPVVPYTWADVRLMLEERDIVLLWLFNHFIRGKRDQFVFRAEFQTQPRNELLVADPKSDLGKLSLSHARDKGLDIEQTSGSDGRVLMFAASSGAYKKLAGHFARTILQNNWPVEVVSYHQHKPHMVAVCGMSPENTLQPFFNRIRKLAFEVLK